MKLKKEHLLIFMVFAIIVLIAVVVIGSALYEPPAEIRWFEAEVIQYDESLGLLLIQHGGLTSEVVIKPNQEIFSREGATISANELQSEQKIRIYYEKKDSPLLAPTLPEASRTYWFCIKIEVI